MLINMLQRLSSSFARRSIIRFNSVKSDNNLASIEPQQDASRVPITSKLYYSIKEKKNTKEMNILNVFIVVDVGKFSKYLIYKFSSKNYKSIDQVPDKVP